jgi:hypothetical protein
LVNLQTNWQLSPRSTLFFGAFYEFQTSTSAAPVFEQSQAAVFAGLFHRL